MPQKKSAKTLFRLCVDNVVEEIDCGSGQKIIEYLDQEILFNPFDELPTSVFEEIIYALERKLWEKHKIRWTITPQLGPLDLSIDCWNIIKQEPVRKPVFEYLKRASLRCPFQKVLKLPYRCVTNENLIGFLPRFNQLQELNISCTGGGVAGDNCLWTLGTYCKHLRYLNVNYCVEVTDFGIQGLCLDYIETENDEEQTRKSSEAKDSEMWERCTPRLCNSLQTLCLKETKVTEKGIQEALQKLRSLRKLKHASIVKVLGEMHDADGENSEIRKTVSKYALSKIKIYDKDNQTTRNCLWKAISLCPLVTALNIGLMDINFHHSKMYTDGYFDSILNVIGNQLEELSLKSFNSLNICSIIDCCPNLRVLKLFFGDDPLIDERLEFSNTKERKPLKKLEVLVLIGNVSSKSLFTLMSSSPLKSITVENCDNFTDDILQKASNLHLFSNLEHVDVWMCDFVTEKGINVLLQESNPLKRIGIYSEMGKSLNKEKVEDWKLQFTLKNWELNFQFHELTRSPFIPD